MKGACHGVCWLLPPLPHDQRHIPNRPLDVVHSVMEDEVYEYRAAELSSGPCFSSQADFNDKPDSLFFNDGVRKIDFILVYEDEDKKDFEKRHTFQRRKVAVWWSTHDNKAQWIFFNVLPCRENSLCCQYESGPFIRTLLPRFPVQRLPKDNCWKRKVLFVRPVC